MSNTVNKTVRLILEVVAANQDKVFRPKYSNICLVLKIMLKKEKNEYDLITVSYIDFEVEIRCYWD